jgi:carbonic anhydrase
MMLKSRSGQVLLCTVILLAVTVVVGAGFSSKSFGRQHSKYEQVLAAVRERVPNWRAPSGGGPGLVIGCVDFRLNGLAHALCAEYEPMYQVRLPGGDIAPVEGTPNTGSATVDMFAGRIEVLIYLGHGDCKWNAAMRERSRSGGTGHLPQMLKAATEVAGSDMEQAMLHMRSTMTNPVLSARIKSGEIEFVGLFLDADGAVYMFDPKRDKYDPIWRPSTSL